MSYLSEPEICLPFQEPHAFLSTSFAFLPTLDADPDGGTGGTSLLGRRAGPGPVVYGLLPSRGPGSGNATSTGSNFSTLGGRSLGCAVHVDGASASTTATTTTSPSPATASGRVHVQVAVAIDTGTTTTTGSFGNSTAAHSRGEGSRHGEMFWCLASTLWY